MNRAERTGHRVCIGFDPKKLISTVSWVCSECGKHIAKDQEVCSHCGVRFIEKGKEMKYISLFSGVEAATVAWEPLGWEAVAFCEIDAFPSAVLAHRFPNVPNLGDITKVDWRNYRGEIDIIVGGSPCQSFSIAGKREGLAGESGLMFEYIRAVQEIRPRYFIWENVPGALSSEKGAAFGQLLSEMDALGYGLAWRVLDAQFFNVAQRRERVFLVGVLGDPERAAEVLFESDCLCWDPASSREKRKELAAAVERGVGGCCAEGTYCIQGDIARGAHMGQNGKGWSDTGESYTLNTLDVPAVAAGFKYHQGAKAGNIGYEEEQSPTLLADGGHPPAIAYTPVLCRAGLQVNSEQYEDMCPTQAARQYKDPPIVVIDRAAYNQGINAQYDPHIEETKVMDTLVGRRPHALGLGTPMQVRKLTPRECERLQGFPDDWTQIPWKGKEAKACPDGPRYKAMGNSMAVPVMRWIGQRIDRVENELNR